MTSSQRKCVLWRLFKLSKKIRWNAGLLSQEIEVAKVPSSHLSPLSRDNDTSWIYTWESGVAQSYTLLCITDLAVRGSLEALFVSLYLMVFALVRVLRGIDFQVQFLGWVVVRVQAVHVSSAMSKFAEIQFRSSTWGIQLQQYTSMCRMHPLTILCRGVWVSLLP